MLLKDKVAVIYGAGAVGAAVARAFARERARLFITDRHGAIADAVRREITATGGAADAWGISWETSRELIAARSHGKRLATLTEMANAAAFVASDRASGMTGTIVNLSLGALDD